MFSVDGVPPRQPFRPRPVPADRRAGEGGEPVGPDYPGRSAADGARGRGPAGGQPEHGLEGLPDARVRGLGRGAAGPGDIRRRHAWRPAAGHLPAHEPQAAALAARGEGGGTGRREHPGAGQQQPARTSPGEGGVTGLNVLELRGLGKRYGEHWALRECTLALPAGHVVGLVGPNGAGKTTLLQLAVGALAPSAGEIAVFGRDPREAKSVLPRVGFVAQDSPLYRSFSVADTLTLGRRLNAHFDAAWAQERLGKLRIPLERKVGELSGGQRAQVALAVALAKRPQLLLLDEPVASLDPLARREFLTALMDAVAEDGLSVVLSSHLIADLERACDYLVLLLSAEVRLAGDIDDLLASHRLLIGPRKSV